MYIIRLYVVNLYNSRFQKSTHLFARDPAKNVFTECIDTLCVGCQHIECIMAESTMGYDKHSVASVSS